MVFSCTGSTFTALSLDYTTDGQITGTITAASDWSKYTKAKLHLNIVGKKFDDKFTLCDNLTEDSVPCGDAGDVIVDMSDIAESHLGQNFTSSNVAKLVLATYMDFSAKPRGKTEHCKKQVLTTGYDASAVDATTNEDAATNGEAADEDATNEEATDEEATANDYADVTENATVYYNGTTTGNTSTIVNSQLDTTTHWSQINPSNSSRQIDPALLYGGIALAAIVVIVGMTSYALKRAGLSVGPPIKVRRVRSTRSRSRSRSRSRRSHADEKLERLVDGEGEMV